MLQRQAGGLERHRFLSLHSAWDEHPDGAEPHAQRTIQFRSWRAPWCPGCCCSRHRWLLQRQPGWCMTPLNGYSGGLSYFCLTCMTRMLGYSRGARSISLILARYLNLCLFIVYGTLLDYFKWISMKMINMVFKKMQFIMPSTNFFSDVNEFIHCGLVTPYGDINLCHQWLR